MRVDSRRADDGIRTRDPHLGKVMRYQLRYIRMLREQILWTICCSRCDAEHYPTDTLLTNRLVRASESGKCAGGECRDGTKTHPWAAIWVPGVDPCSLCPRAPTPLRVARGPVAQWKSVPFTPGRSLVRSQPGPPGQSDIWPARAISGQYRGELPTVSIAPKRAAQVRFPADNSWCC